MLIRKTTILEWKCIVKTTYLKNLTYKKKQKPTTNFKKSNSKIMYNHNYA